MPKTYDIAVLGATAAGYAAAWKLASDGRQAIVINVPAPATESPLGDWVPKEFFQLRGLPKSFAKATGAKPFRCVRFHNAALTRCVEHRFRATAGYFVESSRLVGAFRELAASAGAATKNLSAPPAIRLEEDGVQLVGETRTKARLLMVAHSLPGELIGQLKLPLRPPAQSSLVVAGINIPLKSKSSGQPLSDAMHVIELPEPSDLGMFFVLDGVVHLRVISASMASGTRAAELSSLAGSLQTAGIIPSGLQLGKAKGNIWHPPAGAALDVETHVAKRCLLVGTAGGFAETISGQTLLPTVKSSVLAAEVACEALDNDNVQESLMKYKTVWQEALADYLRPPSTSLRMLMPLLFVNRQILSRFARSMLYGEPI